MMLGSLSSESVERAVQRAKSSGTEDMTATEDAVEYVANWSGDAAEDVGERESHHRSRGKWSRDHCDDWQRGSEIVREPDYLKFPAEAEKEAVDPDQYLDMNDEDECGRDQEVCAAPEFSDAVAAESSGNATSNSVICFGSQSSNEQLWTESDLEDFMRRCKKDWADEEQEELMESLKTLHKLKESWKNMIHNEEVDKSGDENPRVPMRDVSRVTESEGENDDVGMFTHSLGNPGLEKIVEQRMMENSGYRVPSVGVEFNGATKSSSGKSKRMRVWEGERCVKKVSRETHNVPVSEPLCVEQGIPGCASLIREPVQEDTSGHARTHEIRRAKQREENRRNNGWEQTGLDEV